MQDRRLAPSEWQAYFDFVSRRLTGLRVEVEVVGLDLGDQISEKWTVVDGFSYDPKGDAFYVHTRTIEHRIARPQEIYVTEAGPSLVIVAVKDSEGRMQVAQLRQPLRLEAAAAAAAEQARDLRARQSDNPRP